MTTSSGGGENQLLMDQANEVVKVLITELTTAQTALAKIQLPQGQSQIPTYQWMSLYRFSKITDDISQVVQRCRDAVHNIENATSKQDELDGLIASTNADKESVNKLKEQVEKQLNALTDQLQHFQDVRNDYDTLKANKDTEISEIMEQVNLKVGRLEQKCEDLRKEKQDMEKQFRDEFKKEYDAKLATEKAQLATEMEQKVNRQVQLRAQEGANRLDASVRTLTTAVTDIQTLSQALVDFGPTQQRFAQVVTDLSVISRLNNETLTETRKFLSDMFTDWQHDTNKHRTLIHKDILFFKDLKNDIAKHAAFAADRSDEDKKIIKKIEDTVPVIRSLYLAVRSVQDTINNIPNDDHPLMQTLRLTVDKLNIIGRTLQGDAFDQSLQNSTPPVAITEIFTHLHAKLDTVVKQEHLEVATNKLLTQGLSRVEFLREITNIMAGDGKFNVVSESQLDDKLKHLSRLTKSDVISFQQLVQELSEIARTSDIPNDHATKYDLDHAVTDINAVALDGDDVRQVISSLNRDLPSKTDLRTAVADLQKNENAFTPDDFKQVLDAQDFAKKKDLITSSHVDASIAKAGLALASQVIPQSYHDEAYARVPTVDEFVDAISSKLENNATKSDLQILAKTEDVPSKEWHTIKYNQRLTHKDIQEAVDGSGLMSLLTQIDQQVSHVAAKLANVDPSGAATLSFQKDMYDIMSNVLNMVQPFTDYARSASVAGTRSDFGSPFSSGQPVFMSPSARPISPLALSGFQSLNAAVASPPVVAPAPQASAPDVVQAPVSAPGVATPAIPAISQVSDATIDQPQRQKRSLSEGGLSATSIRPRKVLDQSSKGFGPSRRLVQDYVLWRNGRDLDVAFKHTAHIYHPDVKQINWNENDRIENTMEIRAMFAKARGFEGIFETDENVIEAHALKVDPTYKWHGESVTVDKLRRNLVADYIMILDDLESAEHKLEKKVEKYLDVTAKELHEGRNACSNQIRSLRQEVVDFNDFADVAAAEDLHGRLTSAIKMSRHRHYTYRNDSKLRSRLHDSFGDDEANDLTVLKSILNEFERAQKQAGVLLVQQSQLSNDDTQDDDDGSDPAMPTAGGLDVTANQPDDQTASQQGSAPTDQPPSQVHQTQLASSTLPVRAAEMAQASSQVASGTDIQTQVPAAITPASENTPAFTNVAVPPVGRSQRTPTSVRTGTRSSPRLNLTPTTTPSRPPQGMPPPKPTKTKVPITASISAARAPPGAYVIAPSYLGSQPTGSGVFSSNVPARPVTTSRAPSPAKSAHESARQVTASRLPSPSKSVQTYSQWVQQFNDPDTNCRDIEKIIGLIEMPTNWDSQRIQLFKHLLQGPGKSSNALKFVDNVDKIAKSYNDFCFLSRLRGEPAHCSSADRATCKVHDGKPKLSGDRTKRPDEPCYRIKFLDTTALAQGKHSVNGHRWRVYEVPPYVTDDQIRRLLPVAQGPPAGQPQSEVQATDATAI